MGDYTASGSGKSGQREIREWSAGPTVNDTEIFAKYPWWLSATNISLVTQKVYVTLMFFDFDEKGATWHSAETISLWAGVSRKTVYESVRILEGLGLTRIEPQYRKDGGRMPNKHHFIAPDEKQREWIGSLSEKEIQALAKHPKKLDKTPSQGNGPNSLPAYLTPGSLPPAPEVSPPCTRSSLTPAPEVAPPWEPGCHKEEELKPDQGEPDQGEPYELQTDQRVPRPGRGAPGGTDQMLVVARETRRQGSPDSKSAPTTILEAHSAQRPRGKRPPPPIISSAINPKEQAAYAQSLEGQEQDPRDDRHPNEKNRSASAKPRRLGTSLWDHPKAKKYMEDRPKLQSAPESVYPPGAKVADNLYITSEESVAKSAREGIIRLEDAQPHGSTGKKEAASFLGEMEQILARIPEPTDIAPPQPR